MLTTPHSILIVEALLAVPLVLIGVSHIVQPAMWKRLFASLAERGAEGVVVRTFLFELWPAVLVVTFHQAWSMPVVFVTVYGHLLMVKVVLSLTVPSLGTKSMQQAEKHGDRAFVPVGLALIALGAICAIGVVTTV